MRRSFLQLTAAVLLARVCTGAHAQTADSPVAFIQTASPAQRLQYLATARIWRDPGEITPDAILAGRPLPPSSGLEDAGRGRLLPCRFDRAGKTLGGNTPKFSCRLADGRTMHVKYSDGSADGNREVFSAVAAARLMWILGFDSDPIYPITVECSDCPLDPMKGTGPLASRTYLATYQPHNREIVMVDAANPNQGWRWGEVDAAIDALPAGPLRDRQRAHFDALTLLGVFLQHGDRKPEQQRLGCRAEALDDRGGDVHLLLGHDGDAYGTLVFFERAGTTACREPALSIKDVGATFGGAGRLSRPATSKMNLRAWTTRPVFHAAKRAAADVVPACHGALTISMAAGDGGSPNPYVGEAGRQFLLERLQRLSDAHIRALMTTARIDHLGKPQTWRDPQSGIVYQGIEAWVAAFKDKVRQIEERRCAR